MSRIIKHTAFLTILAATIFTSCKEEELFKEEGLSKDEILPSTLFFGISS